MDGAVFCRVGATAGHRPLLGTLSDVYSGVSVTTANADARPPARAPPFPLPSSLQQVLTEISQVPGVFHVLGMWL